MEGIHLAEFTTSPDGLLSETRVRRSAEEAVQRWPYLDALSLEANMMLVRAYKAITNTSEAVRGKFGVTPSRASVIALLHRTGGMRLTVGEIATAQEVSSPNISKLIDGLEASGWVTRIDNPEDRRSSYVELTGRGRDIAEEMLPASYASVDQLWQALTREERRIFVHLLAKLRLRASTRPISADVLAGLKELAEFERELPSQLED